ncbi:MAG: membrane protein required for colicin V production [Dinoroseobacter sp.]|jgi:membrane protein required for colicin V production
MEGFTLIDAIVAGVVVISSLLAFARGVTREIMSIVGWIGAAVVAYIFAGQVEPLVKELPVLGGFLSESCELAIIVAFAAVFAIALVIVSIFTPLMSGIVRRTAVSGIDQGVGLLFGLFRGVILVAIALIVYEQVMVNDAIAMVEDSRSAEIFGTFATTIEDQIPEDATGWIVARYEELVGDCGPGQVGEAAAIDATGN